MNSLGATGNYFVRTLVLFFCRLQLEIVNNDNMIEANLMNSIISLYKVFNLMPEIGNQCDQLFVEHCNISALKQLYAS